MTTSEDTLGPALSDDAQLLNDLVDGGCWDSAFDQAEHIVRSWRAKFEARTTPTD